MRYYLISENWLISQTARRIYRWCGALSFLLIPTTIAIRMLARDGRLTPMWEHLLGAVLIVAVGATAVVYVAMQFFLLVEDESSAWKQILWLLAMAVLGIGPGLYVFFGYSRSEYFKRNSKAATNSAGTTG